MAEVLWMRQLLTSSRGDEGRGHVTEGGSCQTGRVEACKNKVVDLFTAFCLDLGVLRREI
jgi:hypothetical protein